MKTVIIIALIMVFSSFAYAMPTSVFQEMYNKIKAKDYDALEKFLDENRHTYKEDPEYYVILLNYSVSKGAKSKVVVEKGTPKGVEWAAKINDKGSGKAVGFIGARTIYDDETIVKSLVETQHALKYFSNRLDIHFGIISIAGEIKHWDIFSAQLNEILKISKSIHNERKWGPINAMEGNPKEFILNNVQAKLKQLFHVATVETDGMVEKISEVMIRDYPETIYGYSNLGVLYLAKGNYDLAEKYLKQANAIDPNDKIVLGNLEVLEKRRK